MTRRTRFAVTVVALLAAAAAGTVAARSASKEKGITTISAESARYQPVNPGVSKTVLYGNHDKGPYGAFTRFVPGHKNPLHTHSSDVRLVVLEGAYIYEVDGRRTRAGPNTYVLIPAGMPHTSAGDEREGTLFFEESPGGFDLKAVPAPAGKRQ